MAKNKIIFFCLIFNVNFVNVRLGIAPIKPNRRLHMPTEEGVCCECGEPATWVRHTQFASSHFFCTQHARAEEDFGRSDSSYFFWEELSKGKDDLPPVT